MEENAAVYPNPASKRLYIDRKNIEEILLINATGQTMLRSEFTDFINVENMPTGSYLLIIRTANDKFSRKILITR